MRFTAVIVLMALFGFTVLNRVLEALSPGLSHTPLGYLLWIGNGMLWGYLLIPKSLE